MTLINNLSPDIIYEITTYIDLVDICKFSMLSKRLNTIIKVFNNNILYRQVKQSIKFSTRSSIVDYENSFYNFIHYNLINHLYKHRKNIQSYYHNTSHCNYSVLRDIIIHQSVRYDSDIDNFTQNRELNKLFKKVFRFYVYHNFCNISYYPNKFELCALYNLLQIEIFQNISEFDYWLRFTESLPEKYRDIKFRYYSCVLDLFHINNITFDQMYTISHTVITLSLVKKIMGYKVLDLSKAEFHFCCFSCNEEYLSEICNVKLQLWNDDLISHNYLQLKQLLKRTNTYYYNLIISKETHLLNDMIYVKNPITNRRMRVNGNVFKRTISMFKTSPHYHTHYSTIQKQIHKRREFLRQRVFT